MAVTFESMDRRMPKIEKCLAEYGIANLEEAKKLCTDLGFDPYEIVKGVQPIAGDAARRRFPPRSAARLQSKRA